MTKELVLESVVTTTEAEKMLVLFNDHVNSFDWVIQSLIEVCNHDYAQAEQCAIIAHHKGKYGVKAGSFKELRPRCEALLDRGLTAEIQ